MPRRLKTGAGSFAAEFAALCGARRGSEAAVDAIVAEILANVKSRGDAAVLDYTKRFDNLDLTSVDVRVAAQEVAEATAMCPAETLAALQLAARRIEAFHRRQLPRDDLYTDDAGIRLGWRWRALASVGVYVPGGTAAYPSSVLMNAIPAKVAGVGRVVMVVPAPDGILNPIVLAAAALAGVDEIYRIGGAQAVGALAYGTASIAAVDKIVGPGNAYVVAAKKHVFGTVGIDLIAGPSEIVVVADRHTDPGWIAADLISQAEHDPAAQSILITDDAEVAERVGAAVDAILARLPRRSIAAASWNDHGAIIEVADWNEAVPLVDKLAPEHLELALNDAEIFAARVTNAGAIFLGRYTPEAIGDYVGGPNHVLPTARTARFSSGLGVLDFMKRTSLLACDAESLRSIGGAAVTLARAEGLDAHALSVAARLHLPR
jgi:histidinol dehydrogenase